jgi:basic amino acid/polyamine antiporter, APA family
MSPVYGKPGSSSYLIGSMEETPAKIDKTKIALHRALGLPTGILLVAGIMIGSGVFKKIVPMSQSLSSEPGILMAWVVAGVITMLGAFTYAGLASMTTESGGIYEYLRLSYGNFFAFLFGWMIFMIGGSGAIAALAFVFSQAVNTLLPFPEILQGWKELSLAGFIYPFASAGIKIFAILVISLLTWINCRGVRYGGILNNIVTIAKIAGIAILIIAGFLHPSPSDSEEVEALLQTGEETGVIISAFFGAILSALWAYDGWANITYISGEIKNPKKNVPLAIIGGVSICMTLYILLNYVYIRVLPLPILSSLGENQVAAAEVAGVMMGKAGSIIITVLIMICTLGAVNACIITYPRLYFRMGQKGSFFRKTAYVHPVFRTPYIAILVSSFWSSILVITGTFDLLTNLVIFTGFLFFGLIAFAVIKMTRKGVIKEKVIGYPFVPAIIIIFSAILVVNTMIIQPKASILGLLLVLSGIPFYYYFKKDMTTLET